MSAAPDLHRLEVIRDVLLPAAPATVLARDSQGATPLVDAVQKGHLPVLQLCLAAAFPAGSPPGAWLAQRTNEGATLLHVAAAHDDLTVLEHLLSPAPDPAAAALARDGHGWVPLHYAAQNEREAAVAALLRAAPGSMHVHATSNEGGVPLVLAVKFGHLACVRRLVAAAPDTVTAQSFSSGWSAVHFAAQLGDADILRVLLAAARDPAAAVLAQADGGWNAVHIAAQYEKREVRCEVTLPTGWMEGWGRSVANITQASDSCTPSARSRPVLQEASCFFARQALCTAWSPRLPAVSALCVMQVLQMLLATAPAAAMARKFPYMLPLHVAAQAGCVGEALDGTCSWDGEGWLCGRLRCSCQALPHLA